MISKWAIGALVGLAFVVGACSSNGSAKSSVSTPETAQPSAAGQPVSTSTQAKATAKPQESAGDAVKRQLSEVDKGQFGPEWDELHPAQQAIVSRDLYVQCAQKAGMPQVDNVKVTDTYSENLAIPGTDLRGPSTAVSVTYTMHHGSDSRDSKATFHEFAVDGKWRWVLADVEAYKTGKCP